MRFFRFVLSLLAELFALMSFVPPALTASPPAPSIQNTLPTYTLSPPGNPCSPNALLVLHAQDFTATSQVIQFIEQNNGCVIHVFPPQYLIVHLDPSIQKSLSANDWLKELYDGPILPTSAPHLPSWLTQIWQQTLLPAQTPDAASSTETLGEPLINDTRQPVLPSLPSEASQETAVSAGYYQTSEFMAKRIAVGIILPESNGALDPSTENWNADAMNKVIIEIQQGMNWWATQNPAGNLTFIYDTHLQVPTRYEPINRSSDDDTYWMNEIFSTLGYTGSYWYYQAYAYLNAIRNQYNTDWAVVAFVVNSLADSDGKFTDGYFGYTYVSPGVIVMTYDNDGWGINNMDSVMAHEFAHDFGAADEYCSPGYSCCYGGGSYGYLGIANSNCEAGCDNNHNGVCDGDDSTPSSNCHNCPTCVQVNCLMRNGSVSAGLDIPTRYQVGMRDSDGDGILDPLDTIPALSITSAPPDLLTGNSALYRGSTTDIPWDSPTRNDVTINYIIAVEAQLDNSGAWLTASADDGAFDEVNETFTLTLNNLSPGTHTVAIRSRNRSGNISSLYTDSFTAMYQPVFTYHMYLPFITSIDSTQTYSKVYPLFPLFTLP